MKSSIYSIPFDPKICAVEPNEHDALARVIYETLYGDNPVMPAWESIPYQDPRTTAGYAGRLIQQAAHNIRVRFLVTSL